jgi:hypothetical protein
MMLPMWFCSSVAGLAGGFAWFVGMQIFFGPAQGILRDPNVQSAQLLTAFSNPRSGGDPAVILIGLLTIGLVWGWVYGSLARACMVVWWQRGLRFAALAWALMVPWFEFYLPWNVLREPPALVILEMVCWAGVMTLVGLTIAGMDVLLVRLERRSIQ